MVAATGEAEQYSDQGDRYGRHGSFWRHHPGLPYRPIVTYEIWNAPNTPGSWCPAPEPERRPCRLPFHEVPNVLITPHSSSSTEATADRRWSAVAANLDPLDARADAAQPEGPHGDH